MHKTAATGEEDQGATKKQRQGTINEYHEQLEMAVVTLYWGNWQVA